MPVVRKLPEPLDPHVESYHDEATQRWGLSLVLEAGRHSGRQQLRATNLSSSTAPTPFCTAKLARRLPLHDFVSHSTHMSRAATTKRAGGGVCR